jgi:sugar phosphate isomerase/epimerase
MRTRPPDANLPLGMTVIFAHLDIEQAITELAGLGFGAAEIFVGHLGPRQVDAPVTEAHAAAIGEYVRGRGMVVSTLNCIAGEFDPFSSAESLGAAASAIARNLRLASAMGSPRILLWDGELDDSALLPSAPARLAQAIEMGRRKSGLTDPPQIAVELHPNTFAFRHSRHEETAVALVSAEAGVCLDFCHAAVALGPDFADAVSDSFIGAVTHVHYADSDCASEQLHFPPGRGSADLDSAGRRLAGRGLAAGWDLFGWPAPRQAAIAGMQQYMDVVRQIGGLAHQMGAAGT